VRHGCQEVNDPLADNNAGSSSHTRELDKEGLDEFLETKHVHWDFAQENKAQWFYFS
jgi:hypothetical protein